MTGLHHRRPETTRIQSAAHPVHRILTLLTLALLAACESGVIVHDSSRAAELIVDCLTSFKSRQGIRLAYEWTDDQFKQDVSFNEFSHLVASIREINRGAEIQLTGYETFGPREIIVVYAGSQIEDERVFYKFTLVGTRPKDYYLLDLGISDSRFDKIGIYREYLQSIVVKGV